MTTFGWSWMRRSSTRRSSIKTQRHEDTEKQNNAFFTLCLCVSVSLCSISIAPRSARAERTSPFIIGADISWTLEDEAAGVKDFDKGEQKDLLAILKDHGFNYIRLRVFVDPQNGYARRYNEAFCDLEHTKIMAKRV